MRCLIGPILVGLLYLFSASSFAEDSSKDPSVYRSWISEMKSAERGPFSRLRWFCRDGTILPPEPYACEEHGDGFQHGQWSQKTLELRREGYLIANLLAGADPDLLIADPGFRNGYISTRPSLTSLSNKLNPA